MGAKRLRTMPATVIDLLEQEWETTCTSATVTDALARWGREDPVLAAFPTMTDLFAYAHCRGHPAGEREDVLAALGCRAAGDVFAAETLLQLLLPGCKALVGHFAWMGNSAGERAADVVGDVWAAIRALPASPRPRWVARPVLTAARHQLCQRAAAAGHETPALDETLLSELETAEPARNAAEELAHVLADARRAGVLDEEQSSLIWRYRVCGVPTAELRPGRSVAATERLRQRAEAHLCLASV